jgi:hypothetical protein
MCELNSKWLEVKMIRQKKHTVWLVVLCIIFICTSGYSIIWHNKGGSGYEEPDGGQSIINNSIESNIVQGAGYYFNAVSGIQKLLRSVELKNTNGIDEAEFNQVLDDAIKDIKSAISTYDKLIKKAEVTPYRQSFQEALKDFSYDDFMVQNDLNRTIFNEVEDYLYKGDITGVFKRTYAKLVQIDAMLNTVKNEFTLNKVVSTPILWQLNETTAQLSLFGSYTARIFEAIQ